MEINARGEVREGNMVIPSSHRIKSARYWRMNKRRCRGYLLPYHNCCKEKLKSPGKWHSVFKILISSLLAVAALKYQGKGKDPFETKPIVTWCFLISISLYCLTTPVMLLKNQITWLCCRLAFGALSLVSLLSLFLP